MKVLLAGDTHGNTDQIAYLCEVAKRNGCELILQLGDFGLWPTSDGKRFLMEANATLHENGLELWWLDGNHEDHARIEEWSKRENFYLDKHKVLSRIFYLPRGYRFELGGLKCMSLGGAWSIDQDGRTPYIDWWPQEELTAGDVERALADPAPLDVLFTHDMPENATRTYPARILPGGQSNRRALQAVVDSLKPAIVIHGHWHREYVGYFDNDIRIMGLNCDGTASASWAVLGTEAREVVSAFGRAHIRTR